MMSEVFKNIDISDNEKFIKLQKCVADNAYNEGKTVDEYIQDTVYYFNSIDDYIAYVIDGDAIDRSDVLDIIVDIFNQYESQIDLSRVENETVNRISNFFSDNNYNAFIITDYRTQHFYNNDKDTQKQIEKAFARGDNFNGGIYTVFDFKSDVQNNDFEITHLKLKHFARESLDEQRGTLLVQALANDGQIPFSSIRPKFPDGIFHETIKASPYIDVSNEMRHEYADIEKSDRRKMRM